MPSSSSANFAVVQLMVMGVLFARYIVYLLTARGLQEACYIAYDSLSSKRLLVSRLVEENRLSVMVYLVSVAVLVTSQLRVYEEDFPLLLTGYLICQYLQMEQKPAPTINYGTGMACSFFEGYLSLVIPSHGVSDSFVDKIITLEGGQGVAFPVKKLLLIITKSLFCPPDLKHFNLPDRHDLPQIEACSSPEEVCRDVAGVKQRRYRNTAYKIYWPDHSHPAVYITAECATPLHTLYNVLHKRTLYEELADVDVSQIKSDFCSQVTRVVARSADCRGKCELVYFDDTPDSGEYLPLVLLQKVKELEPNYREIIARREEAREDIPEHELINLQPRVGLPTNEHTDS